MSNREDSILVFHLDDTSDSEEKIRRGFRNSVKNAAIGVSEVAVATMQNNMSSFLSSIDTIIGNSPKDLGHLELQEIEIQAQIDGKGNVGISAIAGAEMGIRGGIKFVLRRKT